MSGRGERRLLAAGPPPADAPRLPADEDLSLTWRLRPGGGVVAAALNTIADPHHRG